MNSEQQARLLFARFTELPETGPLDAEVETLRKEHALVRLDAVVARHSATRSRARFAWGLGLGVMAAAAAVAVGVSLPSSRPSGEDRFAVRLTGTGTVRLAGQSSSKSAQSLGRLAPGGELEVLDDSGVQLVTPQGIAMTLPQPARVALGGLESSMSPELRLLSGAVTATVPKLRQGQTFSVSTPNARVVVHGTKFSVVWRAEAAETCVAVVEGVVSVTRGGTTVRLGEGQSSGCVVASPSVAEEVAGVPAPVAALPSSLPAPAVRSHAMQRSKATNESLARANRLLRSALQLEQQARFVDAEAALRELLASDPNSPLAPDARDALLRMERARRVQPR